VLRQAFIIIIILHLESILLIVEVRTAITSLGQIVEFFNLVLISFTSCSLRILIHRSHIAIDVHFGQWLRLRHNTLRFTEILNIYVYCFVNGIHR
jgi:hypothetical protein